MLSDKDIKKALEDKWIEISPLDQGYIQPSSVDLRVGTEFRVFENHKYSHIDPKSPQEDLTTLVEASKDEPFVLHPGEFVLGTTYEKVALSNKIVARLEGKSRRSSFCIQKLLSNGGDGSFREQALTLPPAVLP